MVSPHNEFGCAGKRLPTHSHSRTHTHTQMIDMDCNPAGTIENIMYKESVLRIWKKLQAIRLCVSANKTFPTRNIYSFEIPNTRSYNVQVQPPKTKQIHYIYIHVQKLT